MRWRMTWPNENRPQDGVLICDDGRTAARVYRVNHGPDDVRWRWFMQIHGAGAFDTATGAAATKAEAKAICEARARAAGLT